LVDMRYHVFSLVAVFLALGIGMLLGTTLIERGLVAEQKAQIKSLQAEFKDIKASNSSLHEQLSAFTRYADESRPYMITNMLPGKNYAVVTSVSPDEAVLGKINEGLLMAGATAGVTITISNSAAFNDAGVVANLASLFQMPVGAAELKKRVFNEIVNQLSTASNTGILQTLQQLGVIHIRGALTAPVAGAVLLGPVELASLDKTDAPLVDSFVASAFPVIGVTGSKSEDSVLLLYKKHGIATVDHVDTASGQVALDMSLAGKPGNYGSGKAATRMLPPP
jgi:hypothetical protein